MFDIKELARIDTVDMSDLENKIKDNKKKDKIEFFNSHDWEVGVKVSGYDGTYSYYTFEQIYQNFKLRLLNEISVNVCEKEDDDENN